ncbi:MAG: hypothetical protein IPH18_12900 [Chitinophagaceae bacterium]|nr:hypothetical protein [Chitinophagaceae bacterium]MBK8951412.1 hypothetical protein [Chitinophagaceae bacterium]
MKVKKLLWLLPVLAVVGYAACRKTDSRATEEPSTQVKESRFFSEHTSTNPQVQGIAKYLERQNEKLGFVEKTVKKIGYPRWNKTFIVNQSTGINPSDRLENEDTTTIYYIPFVRDSQNYVNASLLIRTQPSDTAVQYLMDWQYQNYGFDSTATGWNANSIFHVFAMMDNLVFGRTQFRIIDSNLLVSAERNALNGAGLSFNSTTVTRTLDFAPNVGSSNLTELLMPVEVCTPVTVCLLECPPELHGFRPGLTETLPCCLVQATYSFCTTVMVYIPSGDGGDGGSGSGGTGTPPSGGGGGGGLTPGDCGGVAPQALIETADPCTSGWGPVNPDEPPVTEPVDTMLARYSRIFNSTADSIFALSNSNNEEWGHILVQNASNNVYPKNCTTSHDPGYVKQNRSILNGEIIIGELHTHPDPSPNPLNRSAPSGADLAPLRINSKQNYTVFVDCGNVRYALVIENVSLSRSFFASNPVDLINYNQSVIAQSHPDAYSNWQNATQAALLQLIGSSSNCGIGFYKSDATKTNFVKLN